MQFIVISKVYKLCLSIHCFVNLQNYFLTVQCLPHSKCHLCQIGPFFVPNPLSLYVLLIIGISFRDVLLIPGYITHPCLLPCVLIPTTFFHTATNMWFFKRPILSAYWLIYLSPLSSFLTQYLLKKKHFNPIFFVNYTSRSTFPHCHVTHIKWKQTLHNKMLSIVFA